MRDPGRSPSSSAIIAICARTCADSLPFVFSGARDRIPGARRRHDLQDRSTPAKARSTSCTTPRTASDCSYAGGGKSGVLRALREDATGLAKTVNVVGLDLTPEARSEPSTASSTFSLASDQVARRNDGGIADHRDGRRDAAVSPFNGCCLSKSTLRKIFSAVLFRGQPGAKAPHNRRPSVRRLAQFSC